MVVVEHVAHREPELIEVVLDAKQLEGVAAVAIDQVGLQHAQPGDLAADVVGVGDDRHERQDQPDQQAWRRRATVGNAVRHSRDYGRMLTSS